MSAFENFVNAVLLWGGLGFGIYVWARILLHIYKAHDLRHPFRVLMHLEPSPGWITCPKCDGAQGWLNDHGVLRKMSDVSHTRFGNYGSRIEYETRSFFAKGSRGGPHTFWVPCMYCGEMGYIPDHPARKHVGPVNKTATHRFDPDKTFTTRRPHPRPMGNKNKNGEDTE